MWENREQAGIELAKKLAKLKLKKSETIVLAIPRGGVPIGAVVAKQLGVPLSLILVRKIPIPWAPEAGFGAVGPDGSIYLNKKLVKRLGLNDEKIQRLVLIVLNEIRRRLRVYKSAKIPHVKDKTVIIVDDGLASGYTVIAAIKTVAKVKPKSIIVAVPVASVSAFKEVGRYADKLIALIIDKSKIFAVANWYQEFPDLTDEQVIDYLKKV
jgi:putative phosphoribosyl transferase